MIITLEEGEALTALFLGTERYSRARSKGIPKRSMGSNDMWKDPLAHDKVGLYAELALNKYLNTYPIQSLSLQLKTKRSGKDMGDVHYEGINIDVKATIHDHGVLWIDKDNPNIDYYCFFVVKEAENKNIQCDLKGFIKATTLHEKQPIHRKQFRFPCKVAEQNELIPLEEAFETNIRH